MNPVAVIHELVLPTEGKLFFFPLDGRDYDSVQLRGWGRRGQRNVQSERDTVTKMEGVYS